MARNDISYLKESIFGHRGSKKYQVTSGTTLTIKAGEPVTKSLGSQYVTPMYTTTAAGIPVVATDYVVGIAASDSTETTSAAGTVEVTPMNPNDVLLIGQKTSTYWDTQAKYDALVSDRVLLDFVTAGHYTILSTDGSTYGCVIQDLDISKYPGKTAFSFRAGLNYLA